MAEKHSTIENISWGSTDVIVNGNKFAFRDCILWPEGAKEWDWNLTGTHHNPGIQPSDIDELIKQKLDILILSRGMHCLLHTSPETLQLLDSKGFDYYREESSHAAILFNKFARQGYRVGGLFHSTC